MKWILALGALFYALVGALCAATFGLAVYADRPSFGMLASALICTAGAIGLARAARSRA